MALKRLKEDQAFVEHVRERFRREARILAEHPHPCLVGLLDSDLDAAVPYLACEYMPGGDLHQRLAAGEVFPVPALLPIGEALAQALAHLHGVGVLHRDVKPANILFDASGQARLADFGLALGGQDPRVTKTGVVVGTVGFLAPELLAGADHSEGADVYALGVLLAVLALRGQGIPAAGHEVGTRIGEVEPPALRRLLGSCLARDPEDRPGARELAEALPQVEVAAPRVDPGTRTEEVTRTRTLTLDLPGPGAASEARGTSMRASREGRGPRVPGPARGAGRGLAALRGLWLPLLVGLMVGLGAGGFLPEGCRASGARTGREALRETLPGPGSGQDGS